MDPLKNPEAMFATIALICEREKHSLAAEVLRNCKVELEGTDYDNWNNDTSIFDLHLQIGAERYAIIRPQLQSIEKLILAHAKALVRHIPNEHIREVIIVPEVSQVLTPLRAYRTSTPELHAEIEAQRALLIAVATGGPRIQSVDVDYQSRRDKICAGLKEREVEDPNPFGDLWAWYGKWSSGDLPTYQSRRQFISELYAPLLSHLRAESVSRGNMREPEPTGWFKVDRAIHEARQRLSIATTEEQFQAVGLISREVLISLGQTVFDPNLHPTSDGVSASRTDAKRMLDAFIANTLIGSANEVSRRHAKAALDLANDLQHKRTANFRDAALCAEATTSVVNLIAIISGQRDP